MIVYESAYCSEPSAEFTSNQHRKYTLFLSFVQIFFIFSVVSFLSFVAQETSTEVLSTKRYGYAFVLFQAIHRADFADFFLRSFYLSSFSTEEELR